MLQLRLAVPAVLVVASGLGAACSVYDEGLLGAGGEADTGSTRSSASSDGGSDGDGGAAPGSTTSGSTSSDASSTTSSSAATTTGATGTVTTGGGCETVDDCPGEDSDCAARACNDGACSIVNEQQGVVVDRQAPGDCQQAVCDGEGRVESIVDDLDIPEDEDDCTIGECTDGRPSQEPADEGERCDGDGYCTLGGACVECLDDDDCAQNCSEAGECVDAECDDGDLNGLETDTDCGGPDCPDCANGAACDGDGDCLSGDCATTCQPSCIDGVKGVDETDVDCGGVCPENCVLGLACEGDADCDSDLCQGDACRPRLFITEYIEGLSNDKALEIVNYGNVDVDLAAAACFVRIFANGSPSASASIALTGVLPALDLRVVCKSTANAAILAECQQTSTLNLWNGNDAIAIECMGVNVDVFGQIGFDSGNGSNENPGWGTNPTNSVDNVLRRKDPTVRGDPNGADVFDPSVQWDGFAADDFTDLGDF